MADWPLTAPDGSYELGGGDFGFGQNVTEDLARSLFQIPEFDALNALTVLPELLMRLPLEALQRFQSFIPDVLDGAFNTVTGAVEAIMGALTDAPRILGAIIQQLNAVLSEIFGGLDLGDLPSPEEFWDWIVTQMIQPLELLLGPNSPLNVLNLVGQIPQALFGLIPASAIVGGNPNLLTNPGFDGAIALLGGGIWSWDDILGRTTPGSAKTAASGTMRALLSNPVDVQPGQVLSPSVFVRTSGYAGTGTPIRLDVRTYNTGVVVATSTIAQRGASEGAWAELTGDYTVPAGVTQLRLRLVVDTTATAGDVWFDDGTLAKAGNGPFDGILSLFGLANLGELFGLNVDDVWSTVITAIMNPLSLLEDTGIRTTVEDLVDQLLDAIGLSPLGSILDKILDLTDGIGDWLLNTEGTTADLSDLIDNLLANPASVIGQLSQSMVDGLSDAFSELAGMFGGGDVTDPITSIGEAIGGFLGQFFRGGTQQVVTQNRVAEPSGIPPMDSATKIPWTYLPAELMTTALGMPWVAVTKNSNQSIPASTSTLLTGWSQSGPTSLTIGGNKFKLPIDGMWSLEIVTAWSSATISAPLTITVEQNGVPIRRDATFGSGINKIQLLHPAASADEFGVFAYTTASGMSVQATDTLIKATYLGSTTVPSLPPPPDPVTFDAVGEGETGIGGGTASWYHTFGPNSNTIFISMLKEKNEALAFTVGGHPVTLQSGPTVVGNSFGWTASHAIYAAILPESVRGTTQLVESGSVIASMFIGNSLSFNNVGSIGTAVESGSGSGPARIQVPANSSSMIAFAFTSVGTNFGTLSGGTQDWETNFNPFTSWPHLIGHGVGGSLFSASAGSWKAKGIELHP